jgi:hypothetical protein
MDQFPVVTSAIKNGKIFKFRGPIGNLRDKREIRPRRTIPTIVIVGSKNPERNQGCEQVFDPLTPLGELQVILFII